MSTIPKEIQDKMNKSINALGYELPAEVWNSVYDIWNEYKSAVELATDGREELEKENERLRVLVKEGFVLLQQHWKKPLGQIDRDWETFKTQNNL